MHSSTVDDAWVASHRYDHAEETGEGEVLR